MEILRDGIVAVFLNPCHHKRGLVVAQEMDIEQAFRRLSFFGEINDEKIGAECKCTADDSLHDAVGRWLVAGTHVSGESYKIHLQPAMPPSSPLGAVGSAAVGP